MPESFGSDNHIDLYENPVDKLEKLQSAWREKEHARSWSVLPDLDLSQVDWHQYHPPKVTRKAPTVTSQIILDIVGSSIENIKARVAEEDRRRQEEQDRLAAEEAAKRTEKFSEPYLPIITEQDVVEIHARVSTKGKQPATADDGDIIGVGIAMPRRVLSVRSTDGGVFILPTKAEKRSRFALRKLFQRSHERGESSAMGSARARFLQKFERASHHVNSTDSTTHQPGAGPGMRPLPKSPEPGELV